MSKIIESLRGDLAALHEAGAIGKVTMREFDAMCPPPVRDFGAADIKRLREALKFSQPVCMVCAWGQVLRFVILVGKKTRPDPGGRPRRQLATWVSSVPEPQALLMWSLGLAGLAGRRLVRRG